MSRISSLVRRGANLMSVAHKMEIKKEEDERHQEGKGAEALPSRRRHTQNQPRNTDVPAQGEMHLC